MEGLNVMPYLRLRPSRSKTRRYALQISPHNWHQRMLRPDRREAWKSSGNPYPFLVSCTCVLATHYCSSQIVARVEFHLTSDRRHDGGRNSAEIRATAVKLKVQAVSSTSHGAEISTCGIIEENSDTPSDGSTDRQSVSKSAQRSEVKLVYGR